MPLRLWRRFRFAPGLRVNLSKSGLSLSAGEGAGTRLTLAVAAIHGSCPVEMCYS